jgi:predicted kinase
MLLVVVTGLQATGKSTLAEIAGRHIGAPVLAHDWAMSGLRQYPEVQTALEEMEPPGHGRVGWSILWALARAQLRKSRSVVLDGVARSPQIRGSRTLAEEERARCVVVATSCADVELHRSRVVGRQRHIPHWYELDWTHVERARNSWVPLEDVDLTVDAGSPLDDNANSVRELLDTFVRSGL